MIEKNINSVIFDFLIAIQKTYGVKVIPVVKKPRNLLVRKFVQRNVLNAKKLDDKTAILENGFLVDIKTMIVIGKGKNAEPLDSEDIFWCKQNGLEFY